MIKKFYCKHINQLLHYSVYTSLRSTFFWSIFCLFLTVFTGREHCYSPEFFFSNKVRQVHSILHNVSPTNSHTATFVDLCVFSKVRKVETLLHLIYRCKQINLVFQGGAVSFLAIKKRIENKEVILRVGLKGTYVRTAIALSVSQYDNVVLLLYSPGTYYRWLIIFIPKLYVVVC